MQPNCEICITNIEHTRRYKNARDLYQQHAKRSSQPTNDSNNIVYYSADLQKVIMLPRVYTFKKIIFVRRLTTYNETFVPLGEKIKLNTIACTWHGALSGRNKEDIISTYYFFFQTTERCATYSYLA